MSTDNIHVRYQQLAEELRTALSTMTLSDKVYNIRDEIKGLQELCPHNNGSFDFSATDNCPYCGKKFPKVIPDPDRVRGIKTY